MPRAPQAPREPRASAVHTPGDPRTLLLGLLLLSLVLARAAPLTLLPAAGLLAAIVRWSATPPATLLLGLRPLLWVLPLLFGARLWEAAGGGGLTVAAAGMAGLAIVRILLVLAFALLFGRLCAAAAAAEALAWLLRPLLGRHAQRVAFLLGLTLRTIPELRHRLSVIRLAQRARRGPRPRRVHELLQAITALLRSAVLRSERRAAALALRGHETAQPRPPAPLPAVALLPVLPLGLALAVHLWASWTL